MHYSYTREQAHNYIDSENLFIQRHYPIIMWYGAAGISEYSAAIKPSARLSILVQELFPGRLFEI